MAPMTRSFSPGGVPGPDVAAYYRSRAEGGVGLIVTEGTYIPHPTSGFDPRVPHLYGDEALAGWRRVVDDVHSAGGKMFPQLWHVGMAYDPPAGMHSVRPFRIEKAGGIGGTTDVSGRHRFCYRSIRGRGGECKTTRLRWPRNPWGARVSDRPVLLGGHKPENRRIRRRYRLAYALRR